MNVFCDKVASVHSFHHRKIRAVKIIGTQDCHDILYFTVVLDRYQIPAAVQQTTIFIGIRLYFETCKYELFIIHPDPAEDSLVSQLIHLMYVFKVII